jgi:hypothetical protein
LEKDPPKWLRHYLAGAFPKPFGDVHLEMLRTADAVLKSGGKGVNVAPRGTGKSTLFWGLTLFLILSGREPFPAYLPWMHKDVSKALRFWKNALCFNPRLAEDYPEYCDPFQAARGSSQKCKTLLWDDTHLPTGAELLLSVGMIVFPDGLGVIGSSTVNGNPRGLNHATEGGEVWRPSFVLIDDAQSKEVAKSSAQIADTIDLIDTDVAGMAGPSDRMPIFLLGTILRRGDVVDHYASARDWHCVKVQQITSWPKRMDLWDEIGEMVKDKDDASAIAFYAAHMDEMKEGAAVSWAERFDAKRGEPDAIYSAMRDFYFMGNEAFMAERQGEPMDPAQAGQYVLTVDQILAHATDLPRLHLPERSAVLCGHIDINRVGLHWALAGFDQQMTAHVAAYSRFPPHGELWPENAPELVIGQAITRGLTDLCNAIAGTAFIRGQSRMAPSLVLVDASFNSETVHRFCENWRGPFRVMPAIGRAASRYSWNKSTIIGRPMEQCHRQRPQKRICPYVMFNACYWREVAQRAFLGAPGEAGGCTLFNAGSPRAHGPFAEHVTAERLAEKFPSPAGDMVWKWNPPTGHNDWGDALTGAYVAAAMEGITTSGAPVETGIRRRKVYSAADFRK